MIRPLAVHLVLPRLTRFHHHGCRSFVRHGSCQECHRRGRNGTEYKIARGRGCHMYLCVCALYTRLQELKDAFSAASPEEQKKLADALKALEGSALSLLSAQHRRALSCLRFVRWCRWRLPRSRGLLRPSASTEAVHCLGAQRATFSLHASAFSAEAVKVVAKDYKARGATELIRASGFRKTGTPHFSHILALSRDCWRSLQSPSSREPCASPWDFQLGHFA